PPQSATPQQVRLHLGQHVGQCHREWNERLVQVGRGHLFCLASTCQSPHPASSHQETAWCLPTRNITRQRHRCTGLSGEQRCHIISSSVCEVVHTRLIKAASAEPATGRAGN